MTATKPPAPSADPSSDQSPPAESAGIDLPPDAVRGHRRPTINDVARWAGVSKKTVSRVINESPSVQKDTRDKVQAIIDQTGYAPDPQARGLAFRRSFLIGLVYDTPHPDYVVNMQLGLLDGLRGSGFELVVHPCDRTNPDFIEELRGFIQHQKLFGVVLTPRLSEHAGIAQLLREVGCEYVRLGAIALDEPRRMIVLSDREGGAAAGRHLAELGHRRVGYVSGPLAFRSSHERGTGFVQGLAQAGAALDPALVREGDYTFESGVACGGALLDGAVRPTAIFAANDEMALGVMRAARERGLVIPDDISLVGFDDFQVAARVWPPLTTVHAPVRQVGRLAAQKLIGRSPESQTAVEAPTMVVRGSTAPPKA